MSYFLAFLAAVACDSVPAFLPPSWVALIFFQLRYGVPVAPLVLCGVAGSTLGRLILTTYVHKAAALILSRHEERNIHYLGRRLGLSWRADTLFVSLYCMTPLSTTPLFLAAGISGVSRWCVFPGFVAGKLVGYALILTAGKHAAGDVAGLFHGRFTWTGVLAPALAFGLFGAMLFVDWRALLHDGRLRLDFDVLRRRGSGEQPRSSVYTHA